MHHAIAIEENSEKNLYIEQNFEVLFSALALLDASIGMIRFWFHFIAIHPWFVSSYNLFE